MTEQAANVTKPWWKRWWGITLIVVGVFVVLGALTDGDDPADDVAAEATASETGDDETEPDAGTPSAISTPSDEPTAAADPTTDEPEPEPTEEPTPTEEPAAFESISLSGTGDDVVAFAVPAGEAAVAAFTHDGGANFAVQAFGPDTSDDFGELLVNTIGTYRGTVPINFGAQASQSMNELEIQADGSWTVEIVPLAQAPVLTGGGTGDAVVLVDRLSGATPMTHTGSENFAVQAYASPSGFPDLLVNEIGAYDGTVRVPSGTTALVIIADGDWTVG